MVRDGKEFVNAAKKVTAFLKASQALMSSTSFCMSSVVLITLALAS